MLDRLLPGTAFRLNLMEMNRPPAVPHPQDPPGFIRVEDRRYQLHHPHPPFPPNVTPFGAIDRGIHPTRARNFRWLPWVEGKVSYAPIRHGPILTGQMSGCWLTVFRMGGQLFFGHIGTTQNSRAKTEEVKNAWKIAIARGLITPVKSFNPLNQCTTPTSTTIFGAISSAQNLVVIGCGREVASYLVESVSTVNSSTPSPVLT